MSPPEEGELREEEEEEEGEEKGGRVAKKMKLTGVDFKEDGVTPFSYSGVDFADYTKGCTLLAASKQRKILFLV